MVPPTRIELVMTGYQPIVIPFNYRGIFGAVDGNRTRLNLIDNQVPYPEDYNGLNLCWVGAPAPIVLILSHGPCLASCTGIDPVPTPWKGVDLASNLAGYNLVDSNGFEPLRFLQNGFTVRRLQPLGQLSLNLNTLSAMLLDSVKSWMKNVYIKAYSLRHYSPCQLYTL